MIDTHTHCFPDYLASRALSKTHLYDTYETDATIGGQLKLARKRGIKKFLVLNTANTPEQQTHVNEFAVKINGLNNMVISLGSVHPYAADAVEAVERLYEQGIRGIKFQPIRQQFDMDDPVCRPIFQKIGSLGMMTVIHGGRSVHTPLYPVLPKAVGRYIDDFQGAPVVCAHMGGMFCSEQEIKEVAALPVYTDTALCVRHMDQRKFNWAAEQFGPDRILFGTDMPWACLSEEMAYVENCQFSEQEKQAVFEGNAMRALKQCGAL